MGQFDNIFTKKGLPRGEILDAHLTVDYINPTLEYTISEKGDMTSIRDVLKTCPKNDVYVMSFEIPNTPEDIAFATTAIPPFFGDGSKKQMDFCRDIVINAMKAGYQSFMLK